MLKQNPLQYLLALVSLILFILIGYCIERHQTGPLFACYFSLFGIYILLIRKRKPAAGALSFWLLASILFRVVLVFATPALSDDFYRFIWDGRLLSAGYSPFSDVPSFYMDPVNALPGLDHELYDKLNSRNRFSSYPPICQLVFWMSAKISPDSIYGSVLAMKVILLLFEIGTLFLVKKLLEAMQLQAHTILVYALNPLVILEIIGNVHFEGVMIFFLLLAFFLLMRGRITGSTVAFASAVCTKLIPLIFLPVLLRPLGWKKALLYWIATGIITFVLFLPLLNRDIVYGFSTSLGYYFQQFEFNASVYYLVRAAGYAIFGFNIIHFAGPVLAIIAAVCIFRIAFSPISQPMNQGIHSDLFKRMTWCLFIYFISTTILHPWYVITLLAISLYTPYHFPILWTGLIFLTYAGYEETSFRENLLLVSLEYIILLAYISYETLWTSRKSHSSSSSTATQNAGK